MNIRAELTRIVSGLRKNEHDHPNLDELASNGVDKIVVDGVIKTRRRIVLNTHGCSVSTCTMCPLPDESVPDHVEITNRRLRHQVHAGTMNMKEDVLTIYNNGNFFADKEISPEVRDYIYRIFAQSTATTLVVESLPQFVKEEDLILFHELCGGKKLTIAVGLQSTNDNVRKYALNSPCTMEGFMRLAALMKKYKYSLQVFLMLGSPFLSENEQVNDTLLSVLELHRLAREDKIGDFDVVISPLRITKNTLVHEMFQSGDYEIIDADVILAVMACLETLFLNIAATAKIRIATSILTASDGIPAIRVPATWELIDEINLFNRTLTVTDLSRHGRTRVLDRSIVPDGKRGHMPHLIPVRVQNYLTNRK